MTDVTGVDMLQGKLRIELCADGPALARTTCRYLVKTYDPQVYIGSGNSVWGTLIYLKSMLYTRIWPLYTIQVG